MELYLFSINAIRNVRSGENVVTLNFTEQKERSRIMKPGQGGDVVISDEVPLIFAPFMPIHQVIGFFRQAAQHLENQLKELEEKAATHSDNGD